jgi:hypothetical protein
MNFLCALHAFAMRMRFPSPDAEFALEYPAKIRRRRVLHDVS